MSAEKPSPEERLRTAHIVAEYWHEALLDLGRKHLHLAGMAHPMGCVLAALNGETDPEELGVAADSAAALVLRALAR